MFCAKNIIFVLCALLFAHKKAPGKLHVSIAGGDRAG